ncbi:MAG: DUF3418 domain-containing protein, partial [Burkholderiaceae bacterium]
PLPEYAQGFVDRVNVGREPAGSLIDALIADLREECGIVALASDFKDEAVPTHLTMNFRVVDEHGRQLGMGRNLAALRAELGQQAKRQFKEAFSRVGATVPAPASAPARDEGVKTKSAGTKDASRNASIHAGPVAVAGDDHLTDWTLGALPELMEVRRGGQTLIGYPALVDRQTHAALEVFDDPQEAARAHRLGLARLFRLQLAEQLRYLEKNLPAMTKMAMQFMALGTADELRDQIVAAAVERACLADPLPTDAQSFATRKQDAKSRVVLLANEIARTVAAILDQHQSLAKKLSSVKAHPAAATDIEAQLAALVNPRFVTVTPIEQLSHLPRYLKAIALRIEKLAADPQRDAARMTEMAPLLRAWQRAHAGRKGVPDTALENFRWLLEELRVALFAQELRTPMPVSVKRLQKIWDGQQR